MDLGKWQASNHPKLTTRSPEELFGPEMASRYGIWHNDIYGRIIDLHGTISSLETLTDIWGPFLDYIYGPNDGEFWHLVWHNFALSAIITIHGLISDSGDDALTISKVKNRLSKHEWKDPDARDVYRKLLRELKFDCELSDIKRRVEDLRRDVFAHRLLDQQSQRPKTNHSPLRLSEIRSLFDHTHKLFGAISFGASYSTLRADLIPATVGGKPTRPSLDRVIDAVLKDSDFVNAPERDQWWKHIRPHIDSHRLERMDEFRKRVGLPEA